MLLLGRSNYTATGGKCRCPAVAVSGLCGGRHLFAHAQRIVTGGEGKRSCWHGADNARSRMVHPPACPTHSDVRANKLPRLDPVLLYLTVLPPMLLPPLKAIVNSSSSFSSLTSLCAMLYIGFQLFSHALVICRWRSRGFLSSVNLSFPNCRPSPLGCRCPQEHSIQTDPLPNTGRTLQPAPFCVILRVLPFCPATGRSSMTRGNLAGDRPARGEMRPPSAGRLRPGDRFRRRSGRHGPALGRSGGEMPAPGRSGRCPRGPAGQFGERSGDCRGGRRALRAGRRHPQRRDDPRTARPGPASGW